MSGEYKTLNNDDLHGDKRTPKYNADLTFFLVSQCTSCNSINTDVAPGYNTDHSLVTLQISTHNNMRGRGFWKLNTSFLKDEEYIKKIQSIITQTKDEDAQDNTVTPNLPWTHDFPHVTFSIDFPNIHIKIICLPMLLIHFFCYFGKRRPSSAYAFLNSSLHIPLDTVFNRPNMIK